MPSNTPNPNEPVEIKLSAKQLKAVDALMQGMSCKEAGLAAGVSDSTVDTWLKLPNFKAAIAAAKSEAFREAARKLSFSSKIAVDTLVEVCGDKEFPGSVRVRAAESILSNAIKISEMADLQERISTLENSINRSLNDN